MSRRAWLSIVMPVLLGVGMFFARRPPTPAVQRAEAARRSQPPSDRASPSDHASRQATDAETRRATSPARSEAQQRERARRDAMHEQIRERLAARRVGGAGQGGDGGAAQDADDPAADTGGLTNRMGPGTEALARAVNRELMPLAQECIDAAVERDPSLRGMLAVQIDAIGDEDVGAVIDRVEFPDANELVQPELLECVRESSLSMALPPPPQGGETGFMITMKVGEPTP